MPHVISFYVHMEYNDLFLLYVLLEAQCGIILLRNCFPANPLKNTFKRHRRFGRWSTDRIPTNRLNRMVASQYLQISFQCLPRSL